MGFIGRLADMPLTDLVQMLSMSKRTGRLTFTEGTARAALIFRQGDLVAASHEPPRCRLGDALRERGLISEETLRWALQVQRRIMPPPPLGTVLIDLGAISVEALRRVVQAQMEGVLTELVSWENGTFKFEPTPLADALDRELGSRDLVIPEGLRPDRVVLEALRRRDEQRRATAGTLPSAPATAPEPGDDVRRLLDTDGFSPAQVVDLLLQTQRRQAGGFPGEARGDLIAVLKSIMEEGRHARALVEVALLILRCASASVSRGVLLHVARGQARGMGQFGLHFKDGSVESRIAGLQLSLSEPSVFSEVVWTHSMFRGELPPGKINDAFVETLGGARPVETVVIPVVVDGEVPLIFYGDNLPEAARIGGVEILEMLALYAGIEMEKSKLEEVIGV